MIDDDEFEELHPPFCGCEECEASGITESRWYVREEE